jgi:small subunit ribosomal protein S3Ae
MSKRSSKRRVRDKWRLKKWYSIITPSYFGEINISSVPADDLRKLAGRVIETTLSDITDDFSHQSIKLYFLVTEVIDSTAQTILKGHEYSTDYLRSLVRRGTSRIDGIFNVKSKDDCLIRVSIVAFTKIRVKSSQEKAIRSIMKNVIEERAKELSYDQLSHEMVLGKIGSDVYNLTKKVVPLRHVGVRKSKLILMPITRKEEKAATAEAKT